MALPTARPMKRSGFSTSVYAEEILETVRKFEGKISIADLYKKVVKVDPNVPSKQIFHKWLAEINKTRQKRVGYLIEDMKNQLVKLEDTDSKTDIFKQLIDGVFHKIIVMGDVAVQQEINEIKEKYLDTGEPMPVSVRDRLIKIMFGAIDLHTKSRAVDIKGNIDEREQTILDSLMAAAQYGKLRRADVIEVKPLPAKEEETQ